MPAIEVHGEVVMMVNEEVFSKELGQRIARFRKEQGLTQQQMADALRLKQYTVANYEIGRCRLPVVLVPEFARVLGVTVDDLLGTPLPKSKRGPSPLVQRQLEKIQALPKEKQKFVLQALDMVLKTT